MSEALSSLLRRLEAAGVDLDAEAALDAVWLALRMREKSPDTTVAPRLSTAPQQSIGSPGAAGAATTAEAAGGLSGKIRPDRAGEYRPPAAMETPGAAGRAVTFARAPALADSRGLVRALRPLRRRVVKPGSGVLDVETTVRRAAEEDLWIPSFQPARERWLDMLLVADHGLSMIVWKDTIDELERVLRTSGAFRSVRSWWLETDTQNLAISARGRGPRPATPETLPKLARGAARSVILMVSDCVGASWHNGAVPRLLARWSDSVPLALFQVTPDWFWARTALGNTAGSRFRSAVPAATNRRLRWDTTALGTQVIPPEWEKTLFRLPVASLTSDAVARVADLVAGVGREWTPGVIFDLAWEGDEQEPAPLQISAADRVARFLALASTGAKRLAATYAASPVRTLDVLRRLRVALLPSASPFTEAEVVLGGLVRVRREEARWDFGGSLPLEFFPGVQPLILDGAAAADVLHALAHAAEVAASGVGPTFTAWLDNPSSGAGQLDPESTAFAASAADALKRLGGAYARVVKPPPAPAPDPEVAAAQNASPTSGVRAEENAKEGDDIVTMEFVVSGTVQGVGFRMFAEKEMQSLGVKGTARNLKNGHVRITASGPRTHLDLLAAALRKGPRASRVENVVSRVIGPAPEHPAAEPAERAPDQKEQSPAPGIAQPKPEPPPGWGFWEVGFDKDGIGWDTSMSSIASGIEERGTTDVFVLVHGWNVDRPEARATFQSFMGTMQKTHDASKLIAVRAGAIAIFWPSVRWPDKESPADGSQSRQERAGSEEERRLEAAASAVTKNPDDVEARERLEKLVHATENRPTTRGFFGSVFEAAKTTLRAGTFWQMKQRAGLVGRLGLGPFLTELATTAPQVRIHLIAHSLGARLASHAVRAMARPSVVKSLTLIEGIMSRNAFSQGTGTTPAGALADVVKRIGGPIVVTYSRDDNAASTAFEVLARLSGADEDAPGEPSSARGAIGRDGAQNVFAKTLALGRVGTHYTFGTGVFNVDASGIIKHHADYSLPEVAWLVLAAAGLDRGRIAP